MKGVQLFLSWALCGAALAADVAARIENLVAVSAREAVARGELKGKVDVSEKGPVPGNTPPR